MTLALNGRNHSSRTGAATDHLNLMRFARNTAITVVVDKEEEDVVAREAAEGDL